jgi:TRAP-type uncharacterized transport system fused permease subunit
MIVCLILGMGMPTTASYVLASAVLVPALNKLGMAPLVSHLFVFFFACLSAITPPVCSGVFMASSIAQSNWWKTGWLSVALALPVFVIPFTFAYNEALMLIGSAGNLIVGIITAIGGAYFVGVGVSGYLQKDLSMMFRIAIVIGGIMLIIPILWVSLIGLAISATIWIVAGGMKKTAIDPA